MSKEEFLKIQTCVLKVNIHCDGCKSKVKKILQKIDGVYTTKIDSELGKVTVSGNVDPATLIRKLGKSGKHAELWGAPKANQNQLNNQFKNMQIGHGNGGNNKGQKGGNNNQQQPKGGQQGQNQQQQLQQQLQQLQQMKGFQDLKLPQLKDLKVPFNKDQNQNQNQKAVKFNLPEEDDLSDDDFDDDDDDFDDDDEFDDEMDDAPPHPLNKMKNIMGNGQMPNMMMNGQHPQLMNAQAKGGNGGNNGGNGKKGGDGGGGNMPVQVSDGKKGGGGNGNNIPIQGGGGGKNGGKNGGGGGAQNKNGNNAHGGSGGGGGNANNNGNGGKKGGGMNGVQGLPKMGNGFHGMDGRDVGQMGNMPMGQMGNIPMGQVPAVQGRLPAAAMNAGSGGYFNGAGPEIMAGNPHYQQQLAGMMMNQQRANGNERFQPMMYARPPPAVNYMPPYPYPHPYPPPPDPYTDAFSDENTSSCNVM